MPGLLNGLLPYIYSRADAAKRGMFDALANPVDHVQRTLGLLTDAANEYQQTQAQAFADPQNPFKVTDENALNKLNGQTFGLLNFAPMGIIDTKALQAKYPSVDFSLLQSKDGGNASLSKLVVPKDARNQGVGSAFMQDLTQAADADGATLTLTPASDFGGSKNRLVEFYRRFGFVPNRGRNKDFTISDAMYRSPEQP